MKIKAIHLSNFGSYEGSNTISFENSDQEKRVVVIGGKNGAGKTTLFTALQICLYGYHAFGFKSAGKQYFKEIYNLINNQVRLDDQASTYIEVIFEQVTDTEKSLFEVKRTWTWASGEISELLSVTQDGNLLNEEELANFQKYLVHLIPPELLKLYFFDGEKVADYFLGNHEVNIRDALMVLSGNDTFDLLYDSVKRVLRLSGNKHTDAAKDYLEAKQKLDDADAAIAETQQEIELLSTSQEDLQAALAQLVQSYTERGGISLQEWSELQAQLKAEDEKREQLNTYKKTLATDILPFLIAQDLVAKVPEQIREEKEFGAYRTVQQLIDAEAFSAMLTSAAQNAGSTAPQAGAILLGHIKDYFFDAKWASYAPILGLSDDEETQVSLLLGKIANVDANVFSEIKHDLDVSLEESKAVRAKIMSSDIEHFEEHIKECTKMESECELLAVKLEHAQDRMAQLSEERASIESKMKTAKKAFEDELKLQSVTAVSGRVLLLLEDLQKELYAKLIQRVETDINAKFRQLIRKKEFFSFIKIDDNFNLHILRNQDISKEDLLAQCKGHSFTTLEKAIGPYAVKKLLELLNVDSYDALKDRLSKSGCPSYWLPFEIDKNRLSSGEKQIFVMSLYWAMMQQSKNSLPYVIDTPFARIDTEHRANITDYFFKQLNGQLIVLSTDEEISGSHMASMKDQIAHIYMLEYGEDKSTHIHGNVYFED